ncbi:hypothetical protein [Luteolibacter luteus]|uniref:PEP-CTERM sorting domain-containing protein n=1 Tax=Luteolibacter luteus TaxID=2728835 RepID=A0A858RFM8_9BACT|nr:hypothetical protein [Luteolibacter luteus]QJE95100.1 hypothetical protein HHL09_04700 [Luteolibacter luteus]
MIQTRFTRTALQVAAISTTALCSPAIAEDISILAADAIGVSSFTGVGQWSNAAPPSTGNNYFTAGFQVRTPITAGTISFAKRALAVGNNDVSYVILGADPQPWTAVTPGINDGITISDTLPAGRRITSCASACSRRSRLVLWGKPCSQG